MNETIQVKKVHNEIQMRHCIRIREEVFIVEQNVPRHIEIDEHDTLIDPLCNHFLIIVNGMPSGTARAITLKDGSIKIQRVAISKRFRKLGLGKKLIESIEAYYQAQKYVLGAQEHAIPFYEKLGYVIASDIYLDANIRHKDMEKMIDLTHVDS